MALRFLSPADSFFLAFLNENLSKKFAIVKSSKGFPLYSTFLFYSRMVSVNLRTVGWLCLIKALNSHKQESSHPVNLGSLLKGSYYLEKDEFSVLFGLFFCSACSFSDSSMSLNYSSLSSKNLSLWLIIDFRTGFATSILLINIKDVIVN